MTRREKFSDRDYRAAYAEHFLDTYIATQLRVLREQRELTQEQLAAIADMKQSRISTMEDANYSGWSVKTLKRLARAFDLSLVVKFESFGGLLRELDGFDRERLRRPSFASDPYFTRTEPALQEDSTGQGSGTTNADTGGGLAIKTGGKLLPFHPRPSVRVRVPYSEDDTTSAGVALYGR